MGREWEVWNLEAERLKKVYSSPTKKRGRPWSVKRTMVKLIDGKTVLDAGCGHGMLYSLLRDKDYLGFDSSEEMIKVARSYFPEAKERFVIGDAFKASEQFEPRDSVVSIDMLIHLPELEKPLSELWKLTKRSFVFTLKLAKKKDIRYLRSNRFPDGTLIFPEDKHLIIRWDVLSEIEELLETFSSNVEHFPYDTRTEIFRMRR